MRKNFFKIPEKAFLKYPTKGKRKICKKLFIPVLFVILSFTQSFIPTSLFAQVQFSYSYFNITRSSGGGTLETGDTIEIHALGFVPNGTSVTNFYYTDSIRAGTQYIPNSMRIITNEGVTVPGATLTDISGDDGGMFDALNQRLRINLATSSGPPAGIATAAGFGNTTGGGGVRGGDIPIGGGGTLGIVAYKLVITASFGSVINLSGNFYYNQGSGNKKFHYNNTSIMVVQNQGLCVNFSSASFTAESSFGSGNTQNRTAGVNAPGYTKVNIGPSKPNDNYYSIVNNSSDDGTTDNTVPYNGQPGYTSPSSRVFSGSWDIIGDHTGAANPALGNPAVPPGTTGGYMLLVNAAIPTGTVYIDTIKNLCPNTYYEFSAWFRNICGACGQNMDGSRPRPDHGVLPNIAFAVNGTDYYSTGNIQYTQTWVKKGFIYKTGMAETSFVISIKNNASGGDGNDWALDDINLSTCYPNLIMNPNDTATACAGYPLTVSDTVKSFFNNYGNYQWQASKDGGITWTTFGPPGAASPVMNNGLYVYHVDITYVPVASDSGLYFRLAVATTLSNLSNPNCAVANSQKVFLKVYSSNCSVLDTKLLNFNGAITDNKNVLYWVTQNEDNIEKYEIEKSTDGVNFSTIGSAYPGNGNNGGNYTFNDPGNVSGINYYRLKLVSLTSNASSYSKTIMLYNRNSLFKISTINPFHDNLKVEIFLPEQGKVEMNLCDMYGKVLSRKVLQSNKGNSSITFDNVSNLPPGMYILTAFHNGMVVQNKLIKTY